MKVLAWDTSSKTGALVALEGESNELNAPRDATLATHPKLMGEFFIDVDLTHSERLLWGIHQLLESLRWKIEDVDAFGVGVGPGSFTGLRVGLTTARTLAHTLKKPLVGVSSLAALARPLAFHFAQKNLTHETLLITATDACKGELFALWGFADAVLECAKAPEGDRPGLWGVGVAEAVITPGELIENLRATLATAQAEKRDLRWIAIGEGRQRYHEFWNSLPADQELLLPFPFSDRVQGRYLGHLVWRAIGHQLAGEGLTLSPRYLRASNAELRYKNGSLAAI